MTLSAEELARHVQELAGRIGERNAGLPDRLNEAAAYIEREWQGQGYEIFRQTYRADFVEVANLEVNRPGSARPSEIILVGAHYDSVAGSPGANDNGTGVAVLLELSRALRSVPTARTVRLVAFVNEEPPWFQTSLMGSRVHARQARERGDDLRAVIALETLGYYRPERGSQKYPPFFRFFYPDRGNFIAFVSNIRSRDLLHRAIAAFRAHSDFPAECCATWGRIPGVDWSDHSSFWHEGYPALMITDTAPFRYPYYHSARDTPEKVDYASLARVTGGIVGMVREMAGRP